MVGRSVNSGFEGMELGQSSRFAGRDWRIVGVMAAPRASIRRPGVTWNNSARHSAKLLAIPV